MVTRTVEVPPERFSGWVERYAASHPGTRVGAADGGVRLDSDTGAFAIARPLLPFTPPIRETLAGTPEDLVPMLAGHAARETPTALVLLRRGGYAVGLACGARLLASKVGSRYVQSRTAAGGWSQQRFARRREGQAHDLVRAAAQAWAGLAAGPPPAVLVTGGDRALVDALLAEPALRSVRGLGVARHLDVPDPRLTVLKDAVQRSQALLVTIREP
jgi:hypothetical protein